MRFKKYFILINTYWQRGLTHRFTIFAYRIGEMAEILILVLMWTQIYESSAVISAFTYQQMLTYVLVGNLFQAAVRSWGEQDVSRHIKDGRLSVFLVKPVSYLQYIIFQEIGRNSLPSILSVLSQATVIAFFYNRLLIHTNVGMIAVIICMLAISFFLELLLAFLIGLIAFWTDEVDGLYATIGRLKKFFSGGYFPLSLLPISVAQASFWLPFGYSFYVPTQLFLEKFDIRTGIKGILVQIAWLFILYGIIRFVWQKGIRRYEGVGI